MHHDSLLVCKEGSGHLSGCSSALFMVRPNVSERWVRSDTLAPVCTLTGSSAIKIGDRPWNEGLTDSSGKAKFAEGLDGSSCSINAFRAATLFSKGANINRQTKDYTDKLTHARWLWLNANCLHQPSYAPTAYACILMTFMTPKESSTCKVCLRAATSKRVISFLQ